MNKKMGIFSFCNMMVKVFLEEFLGGGKWL